jgi:hypothetical protein
MITLHNAVPHGVMQCNHDAMQSGAVQKGQNVNFSKTILFYVEVFKKG